MNIRTRFAPSPTGYLHVGGLRTALYNYLFAKKNFGDFILRIEDTDQSRQVSGALANIMSALQWAGITPDESPQNPGKFGPYQQSQRLDIYHKYIQELLDKGHAYYDFRTPDEIHKIREQLKAQNKPLRFAYQVSADEIQAKLARQEPYIVRMHIPEREISFTDLVRGKVTIPASQLDDQVLLKSDGFPTYHFANVVDDHLMEISHVIRGEEWLSSTPKHILLYEYFGWEAPQFAHLPLLLNPDRSKLSKRQGDVAVGDYRQKGYLPESFINFIALLGWNPGGDREIFSLDELVAAFSLERINKAGAVFDTAKLDNLNGIYIRNLPITELAQILKEKFIQQNILTAAQINQDPAKYEQIVQAIQAYGHTLDELPAKAQPYLPNFQIEYDKAELQDKINKESALIVVNTFWELTKDQAHLNQEQFKETIKTIQKEKKIKGKNLYMPVRLALTGQMHGPELHFFTEILDQEQRNNRLQNFLNFLKNM